MGITHHLSFAALAPRRRGGLIATAAAIFALGFAAGATIRPAPTPHGGASITTALAAAHDASERTPTAATHSRTFDRQLAYPADVIRIIDGDTFEARVRVCRGSTSIPRCGCATSMRRSFTPAALTSLRKRKPPARRWKRCWRRAG